MFGTARLIELSKKPPFRLTTYEISPTFRHISRSIRVTHSVLLSVFIQIGADSLSLLSIFLSRNIYWLITAMLYGCGLRINEALYLGFKDIDLRSQSLFVYRGIGGKDRYTLLRDAAAIPDWPYSLEWAGKA